MINNIKSILTEKEKILTEHRVHWIVFASPVLYGIIGLLIGVFFHPIVGVVIWVMNLYPIYMASAFYITTRLILTNIKVLGRSGFLSRDWEQINLNRVESAYLIEPIIGRFFGYSTVVISGTGSGNISFPYIVNGEIFTKKLQDSLADRDEK